MANADTEAKQASILFVDDEDNILKSLRRVFRQAPYKLFFVNSGEKGLEIVRNEAIDLVISDMRMPHMGGDEFLAKVAKISPDTMRIILTGFADTESVIKAINEGNIYNYITKPWDDYALKVACKKAIEFRWSQLNERRLLALTQKQNEDLLELNATLEQKVDERTVKLNLAIKKLRQMHDVLKNAYTDTVQVFASAIAYHEKGEFKNHLVAGYVRSFCEFIEVDAEQTLVAEQAALLRNLGRLALPPELMWKPYNNMTKSERELFHQHPHYAVDTLAQLPPLSRIAEAIQWMHEKNEGRGYPLNWDLRMAATHIAALAVVCDFFELRNGLIAPQPLSKTEALDYVAAHSGQFYPEGIVEKFVEFERQTSTSQLIQSELRLCGGQLTVGLVVAQDAYLESGLLLLKKGTELTDDIIYRVHKISSGTNDEFKVTVYNPSSQVNIDDI